MLHTCHKTGGGYSTANNIVSKHELLAAGEGLAPYVREESFVDHSTPGPLP